MPGTLISITININYLGVNVVMLVPATKYWEKKCYNVFCDFIISLAFGRNLSYE